MSAKVSPMGKEETKPKKRCLASCGEVMKKNVFLVIIVLAMLMGISLGIGLRHVSHKFSKRDILYLRFPGDLFLQMLRMLLLPLIFSSLICGTSSLDTRSSGKMGMRAIVYYMTTTVIAAVIGVGLAVVIRPGDLGNFTPSFQTESVPSNTADTLLDLVRNLFPDNLVEACFMKIDTEQVPNYNNDTNTTVYEPEVGTAPGMNVLGLILFAVVLGVIISSLGEDGQALHQFFVALNKATMKMIALAIWYAPVGILFLIAAKIVEMEDAERVLTQLAMFAVTVLVGFILHGFVIVPIIYLLFVKKNPLRFIYGMVEAFVTMLAVASSAATLPVTMRCLVENNGVDPRVVMFIAPVGATINMDGSALYQAIAALFIAQINNIPLNVGQIMTIAITSVASSIGAAAVPSGSLVVITMVLTSVGLPTDITLIATVDWLLDRGRGIVNILGDSIGAAIVDHLSQKELAQSEDDESLLESVEPDVSMKHCHTTVSTVNEQANGQSSKQVQKHGSETV
ncbi:excitatory amino acid transporter 1-like [Liolophura sinensis]|uniref:excitatory amino acid transporter 1-like n=1 Tax=Liolophura sinensis TaxID=3198878 RepID=UPI0031592CE3